MPAFPRSPSEGPQKGFQDSKLRASVRSSSRSSSSDGIASSDSRKQKSRSAGTNSLPFSREHGSTSRTTTAAAAVATAAAAERRGAGAAVDPYDSCGACSATGQTGVVFCTSCGVRRTEVAMSPTPEGAAPGSSITTTPGTGGARRSQNCTQQQQRGRVGSVGTSHAHNMTLSQATKAGVSLKFKTKAKVSTGAPAGRADVVAASYPAGSPHAAVSNSSDGRRRTDGGSTHRSQGQLPAASNTYQHMHHPLQQQQGRDSGGGRADEVKGSARRPDSRQRSVTEPNPPQYDATAAVAARGQVPGNLMRRHRSVRSRSESSDHSTTPVNVPGNTQKGQQNRHSQKSGIRTKAGAPPSEPLPARTNATRTNSDGLLEHSRSSSSSRNGGGGGGGGDGDTDAGLLEEAPQRPPKNSGLQAAVLRSEDAPPPRPPKHTSFNGPATTWGIGIFPDQESQHPNPFAHTANPFLDTQSPPPRPSTLTKPVQFNTPRSSASSASSSAAAAAAAASNLARSPPTPHIPMSVLTPQSPGANLVQLHSTGDDDDDFVIIDGVPPVNPEEEEMRRRASSGSKASKRRAANSVASKSPLLETGFGHSVGGSGNLPPPVGAGSVTSSGQRQSPAGMRSATPQTPPHAVAALDNWLSRHDPGPPKSTAVGSIGTIGSSISAGATGAAAANAKQVLRTKNPMYEGAGPFPSGGSVPTDGTVTRQNTLYNHTQVPETAGGGIRPPSVAGAVYMTMSPPQPVAGAVYMAMSPPQQLGAPAGGVGGDTTSGGGSGANVERARDLPDWFRPDVTAFAGAQLVERQATGTFMIRPSSSSNSGLVLCVAFSGIALNYRITRPAMRGAQGGGFTVQGMSTVFADLPALVHYCSTHERLNGKVKLATAAPRTLAAAMASQVDLPGDGDGAAALSEAAQRAAAMNHENRRGTFLGRKKARQPTANELNSSEASRRIACLVDFSGASRWGQATERATIDNFIKCTEQSHLTDPVRVCKNIRQFLSGFKHFLMLQHGDRIEKVLPPTAAGSEDISGDNGTIDVPAILEESLQVTVVERLQDHVRKLIINELEDKEGSAVLLPRMLLVRELSALELEAPEVVENADIAPALYAFKLMQSTGSAVLKMKYLLDAVTAIHESCAISGADDLVPLFIYIMSRSELTMPEVEVKYIMELVEQSVLSGEGGYYLTTFAAATNVVRFWEFSDEDLARAEAECAPMYAAVAPELPSPPPATAPAQSITDAAIMAQQLHAAAGGRAPVYAPLEPDTNYGTGTGTGSSSSSTAAATVTNSPAGAPVYKPLEPDELNFEDGDGSGGDHGGAPVYAPIGIAAEVMAENSSGLGTISSRSSFCSAASAASYAEIDPFKSSDA